MDRNSVKKRRAFRFEFLCFNDFFSYIFKELYERGLKNQVRDLKLIDGKEIKEIEPYCRGTMAIHSPHTGIVDWALVTNYYAKDFKAAGGEIFLNYEVQKFNSTVNDAEFPVTLVDKKNQQITSRYILTCGGLQADKIAALTGNKSPPKIVPFRGEYLLLNSNKTHMVKGNIYPVPDPRFPFLGVHFTPRMDGSVWLGPNAVLAFKREGYTWTDINLYELFDALKYPGKFKSILIDYKDDIFKLLGLIRMATRYIGAGIKEIAQSLIPSLQVKELQKFIPELTVNDVHSGPAGVRAQALRADGSLVDDFIFEYGEGDIGTRILHWYKFIINDIEWLY